MFEVLPVGTDMAMFLELGKAHFQEVEDRSEHLAFTLNTKLLQTLLDNELLVVIIAREEGALIGYHLSLVSEDFMTDTLVAREMAIYVDKPHRSKGVCEKMFEFLEEELLSRGVSTNYTIFKDGHNEEYPKKLGYTLSEIVYEKVLS